MIKNNEPNKEDKKYSRSIIRSRFSLRNKKIAFRLSLLAVFISVILVAFCGAGLYILNDSEKNLTHLFEKRMLLVERVSKIQKDTVKVRMMLLRAMHHVREGSDVTEELGEIRKLIKEISDTWGQTKNIAITEKEKELLAKYQEARQTLGAESVFPLLAALQASDSDESSMIESVTGSAYDAVENSVDVIVANMRETANQEIENSLSRNLLIRKTAIAVILFGLMLVVMLSVYIIRSVTQPLQRAIALADRVAAGDLTDNIQSQSNDEIAHLLNALGSMSTRLRNVVGEVHEGVNSIVIGSREISSGNTNLSQRTEEQASSLEESASSMEQMAGTVKQNANNAEEAKMLAISNQQRAENGANIVMQTVDAMSEINQSSSKISEIITTIDGIAFQTNLLALNAAVEAARAGEQGRGFAVVAGEVRSLAQRSAEAAKDIKALIEDSVDKVKNGTRLADESGKTLEEIIEGTQQVANIVSEIAAASNEQASGINQVNSAITQMDDMTQQNAALVEEAAAASRSMEDQANSLMQTVDYFKLDGSSASTDNAIPQDQPVELASNMKQNEPDSQHHFNSEVKRKTGTDKQGWEDF